MSAAPHFSSFGPIGRDLVESDFAKFADRWITPELAVAAGYRRVNEIEGRELVGRKHGDMSGLAIPYRWPGDTHVIEWRLRRDRPDVEREPGTDRLREVGKYIGPPGARNHIYFPPGVSNDQLQDAKTPILLTEGEFKCLAAQRAAQHNSQSPRFLPIAIAGVWAWRGRIGKAGGPDGERLDVKGVIPDIDRIHWEDRLAYLAFDADIMHKPQVQAALAALTRELRGRGANVAVLEWDLSAGKGVDDYLAANGPEAFLKLLDAAKPEPGGWKSQLIVNEKGVPKALLANALVALRQAPEWRNVLQFNEFTLTIATDARTPWGEAVSAWSDNHDRLTAEWLQTKGIHVGVEVAAQAAQTVARERSAHPVRSYLEGLRWDDIQRVRTWLTTYLGVEPSDYAYAVGERWLISAVARIFEPGVKADHCMILEGAQGIGKSRSLRALGGEWSTDEIADFGSKDASMQLQGAWIIELAELDSINKSEVGRIKAFMSRTTDRFRPPYGRHLIESPRQCVFAGSVNHSAYLRDETGGRRFWPVECKSINLEALRQDRDQLWAEAVALYRAGNPWWLDSNELVIKASEEQQDRFEGDPWDNVIATWIEDRQDTSIDQILGACLDKKKSEWSQGDKTRVAKILRSLKWERYKARFGDTREWRYRHVSR